VVVGLCAFGFGVLDSVFKGDGSGLYGAFGQTAAPWILLAFVTGAVTSERRLLVGGGTGLVATLLALMGFYFVNSLMFYAGPTSWITDFHLAMLTGTQYFVLGLFSGLLFGALGAWWRQHLSGVPVVAVGLLVILEALVQTIVVRSFDPHEAQVAVIEALLGVAWIVSALNVTKLLRRRTDVG
jgi:hypothetical protein